MRAEFLGISAMYFLVTILLGILNPDAIGKGLVSFAMMFKEDLVLRWLRHEPYDSEISSFCMVSERDSVL